MPIQYDLNRFTGFAPLRRSLVSPDDAFGLGALASRRGGNGGETTAPAAAAGVHPQVLPDAGQRRSPFTTPDSLSEMMTKRALVRESKENQVPPPEQG